MKQKPVCTVFHSPPESSRPLPTAYTGTGSGCGARPDKQSGDSSREGGGRAGGRAARREGGREGGHWLDLILGFVFRSFRFYIIVEERALFPQSGLFCQVSNSNPSRPACGSMEVRAAHPSPHSRLGLRGTEL